jgi:hypothetical protein
VKNDLQPWPALPLATVILLAGSFVYVWLRVEPLLEYHRHGPFLYRHQAFFETFLRYPGGLANYAGVALAQANHVSWLGAVTFLLMECALLWTAFCCLARTSGRSPGFSVLVPIFVLLLLRNHYGYPIPAMGIGLLLALGASTAYVSRAWQRPWVATTVSAVISSLLFFLAGIWSAVVFAVLCALFLLFQMRHRRAGLVSLLLAFTGPLLVLGTRHVEPIRLVNPWPEGGDWRLATALYASVPVLAVALLLSIRFGSDLASRPERVDAGASVTVPRRFRWLAGAFLGQPVPMLLFVLGWAVIWMTFDRRQKILAEMDYHAAAGEYESVVDAARQADALTHPAKVRLQWALYHTGRLGDDLFSFLNAIQDAPTEGTGEDWRAQSQPLLELGLVNDAEHMAHEALEIEGDRPDILRLLARINLLKNRPQAAQVFLNVLSLIPFQGERAQESWPMLDAPTGRMERSGLAGAGPTLAADVTHESVGPMLEVIAAANPTNRMAFEYVMAHYLVELDLKKLVEHLPLLENFDYPHIPRSYEEALLLYQQITGAPVELKGHTVRPETSQRFRHFRESVWQSQRKAAGLAVVAAHFGDTYWCYYYARKNQRTSKGLAAAP